MSGIAVLICTRNRPRELDTVLASLTRSTALPAETLVSDDSDALWASENVRAARRFDGVRYVRGPRRGLAANRNHCLDHVSPAVDAVVFVDDDVVVHPHFLARARLELDAAGPRTIVTGWESRRGHAVFPRNRSFWGHQEVSPNGPDDVHGICINATVFPRTLFDCVRFDDALRYGYEEADVATQAETAGYRIVFRPTLWNVHHPSPINRAEYASWLDASRLYATFKNYRRLRREPWKASVFAVAAPVHLLASLVKRRRRDAFRATFLALRTAIGFVLAAERTRR